VRGVAGKGCGGSLDIRVRFKKERSGKQTKMSEAVEERGNVEAEERSWRPVL